MEGNIDLQQYLDLNKERDQAVKIPQSKYLLTDWAEKYH